MSKVIHNICCLTMLEVRKWLKALTQKNTLDRTVLVRLK